MRLITFLTSAAAYRNAAAAATVTVTVTGLLVKAHAESTAGKGIKENPLQQLKSFEFSGCA